MTMKVALIAENDYERNRLVEFASSQHWEVTEPPRDPRELSGLFDAIVAYKRGEGGGDIFQVRFAARAKA
jgi:hypothetical protein